MIALGVGVILYALVGARQGFFIVDEVLYVFAAETFAATGGFTLENGLHLSNSADLLWSNLLTHGPNGITSQYPPGSALLWAPLIENFGVRGILVFNAAALVGAVFATQALARQLFDDDWVAHVASLLFLFGTFSLEYAYVIWPHTISVWTIIASFIYFLRALDDRDDALPLAMLSGLILGAGLAFRIDNILILPVFAILTVLFAARPVRVMCGGGLGMAPVLIAMALVNQSKFGTLNPLSYGVKSGAGTNLANYIPFGIALVALLGGMWVLRTRKAVNWRVLGGVAGVGICAAVAFVPEVQRLMMRLVEGTSRLIVDARGIESRFADVKDMPDGTRSFWGLSKKALGQSLPWLGVLVLLAHPSIRAGRGRAIACALIFCLVFMVPFLMRSWHGGMSSNMRYFLPVLPIVSILAALSLRQFMRRGTGLSRPFALAILLGVLSSFGWMMAMPSGLSGAHQIWALYVFLAVLAVSLVSLAVPSASVARVTLLVAGLGIGVSVFNTATDTLVSQLRRAQNETLTDLSQGYDGKLLIYGAMMRSALTNADQIVAAPQVGATAPDAALVRAALENGYRVIMPEDWARIFSENHAGYRWQAAGGPVDDLVEVFVTGG